jgi:hypothetical protein
VVSARPWKSITVDRERPRAVVERVRWTSWQSPSPRTRGAVRQPSRVAPGGPESACCCREWRTATRGGYGRCARLLGEFFASGIVDHRQVGVSRCRQPQSLQQPHLAWRRVEQVGAADDGVDALRSVVDDHRQLVRELTIRAHQDEIPDGTFKVLLHSSLHAIGNGDDLIRNAHPPGACRSSGGQTGAADAGVHQSAVH